MALTDLLIIIGLTIFGLFILYNLALYIFPPVQYKSYDPVERCEEFVYSRKKYETVFAGSGLIGQLDQELPADAFNLCFPYFGGCTALEIITLSKKTPATVFIETNYLFKGSNKELIRKIFDSRFQTLKYIVPVFLKKNRPVSLIKSLVGNIFRNKNQKDRLEHSMLDEAALARFVRIYNEDPDVEKFEKMLGKMKKHVTDLDALGCQIIFFEMPLHQSLYHARLFEFQRMRLKEVFDSEKYRWISSEEIHDYQTVDGIHLTSEGITRYTGFLMQEVKTILT